MIKRVFTGIIVCALTITIILTSCNDIYVEAKQKSEKDLKKSTADMTVEQLNSIAMLNHLTVLTEEINESSHSKAYLDNAYSDIYNNTNPNAVDEDTLYQIESLLDTIESYRSIEVRRERLKYIFEQNQADAIYNAIPNPLSVMNVVQSGNLFKAMVSVAYMAVDSYSSYKSCVSEAESEYLKDGWDLDDEAAQNLHESRKDAFAYLVEMCNNYNLSGDLSLNENSVKQFAKWEGNKNVIRRITFLENNRMIPGSLGGRQ